MERYSKLRIGILTSSRADYGIYLPLLKDMQNDSDIHFEIIAFGTHLSHFHGYTINNIIDDGFEVNHRIESLSLSDSETGISTSMGLTIMKFADFWANNQSRFDIIFVLGDRFEMFSAISASIPFNFDIAHIHGGEESKGSIDNIFRHSITQMSKIHFTSHELYSKRIKKMLNDPKHVYTVGSLSIDLLKKLNLYDIKEFHARYHIDISIPSILFTFHPETVETGRNKKYALILKDTLSELVEEYQIIITMPNADTQNNLYRNSFLELHNLRSDKIKIIENFGSKGYFSCMKHCRFLIGNSSSGIIEAGSLNKWVVNLGDRQKARLAGKNVIHCKIKKEDILEKVKLIESEGFDQQFENPYDHGSTSKHIIRYIKLYAGI